VVPSDRTRGYGHEEKHRRFLLNIRKHFFTVRVTECTGFAERCRVSILVDMKKLSGHGPGHPALGGLAWPLGVGPEYLQKSFPTSAFV